MRYGKANKIIVWAVIVMCLAFSFISSTPFDALTLIVTISVIAAVIYFEILGYKKEKTIGIDGMEDSESGGLKGQR